MDVAQEKNEGVQEQHQWGVVTIIFGTIYVPLVIFTKANHYKYQNMKVICDYQSSFLVELIRS